MPGLVCLICASLYRSSVLLRSARVRLRILSFPFSIACLLLPLSSSFPLSCALGFRASHVLGPYWCIILLSPLSLSAFSSVLLSINLSRAALILRIFSACFALRVASVSTFWLVSAICRSFWVSRIFQLGGVWQGGEGIAMIFTTKNTTLQHSRR